MLLRIGTAIFLFPVLSTDEIPVQAKAGLAFFLTLILFPTLPATVMPIPGNVPELFALALKEVYVGLIMGFSSTLFFAGLRIAGDWIDQETGFSMLQLFDPSTQEPTTALGSLLIWLFTVLLLVSGGYLVLLQSLAESFQIIPLAGASWNGQGMFTVFARMSADAFVFGLKLAAPVLSAILISSLGLAVTSRIMPQMNVWLVGMPMKLLLGMITILFGLPVLWQVFQKNFDLWILQHEILIRLMGGS